jgi:hypothetical protein
MKLRLYFCSIFKDDRRSVYTVSGERTAVSIELKECGKRWTLSDLRLCQNLLGGTEGNHERLQLEQIVFWPRFEIETSEVLQLELFASWCSI